MEHKGDNRIKTIPFACKSLQLAVFTRLIDCKVLLKFNFKQLRLRQHACTVSSLKQARLDRLLSNKYQFASHHSYQ